MHLLIGLFFYKGGRNGTKTREIFLFFVHRGLKVAPGQLQGMPWVMLPLCFIGTGPRGLPLKADGVLSGWETCKE